VRRGDEWTEQAEVRPSDGAAGEAIALDGNTLLFSALDRTAVYVFVRRGTEWIEQQKLEPTGAVGSRPDFGASGAIDNNVAVIGAPGDAEIEAIPGLTPAGAAFVFVRQGNTWSQQQKLLPVKGSPGFGFGRNTEIDRGLIVVSAPDFCGRACLDVNSIAGFARQGTEWIAAFTAVGPIVFGAGLSLRDGELLASGQSLAEFGPGEAHFFDVQPLPK
jgi:hypothetical protein